LAVNLIGPMNVTRAELQVQIEAERELSTSLDFDEAAAWRLNSRGVSVSCQNAPGHAHPW